MTPTPFLFAANRNIYFHDNGVVFVGWLATATTVKVVDTVGGDTNTFSFTVISFYDNGVVDGGELATAIEVDVVDTSQSLAVTNTFSFAANRTGSIYTRMGW